MIPVDKNQCQAEKPNGQGPFTLGGGHKMVRCTNKPTIIATETQPGEDGVKGSMSMCLDCLKVAEMQLPDNFFEICRI